MKSISESEKLKSESESSRNIQLYRVFLFDNEYSRLKICASITKLLCENIDKSKREITTIYDNFQSVKGEYEKLREEMDNINGLLETFNSKIQENVHNIANIGTTQVTNLKSNHNQEVRRVKKGNTDVEDAGDKKILHRVREQWDKEVKLTIPATTTEISHKPGYYNTTVAVVGVGGLILFGMILGGLIATHVVNKCLTENEDEDGDIIMEHISNEDYAQQYSNKTYEDIDIYHMEENNTARANIEDSSKYNLTMSNESSDSRTTMNVSLRQ